MITDTDRRILNFVDDNGCITIHQAEKMFYTGRAYAYDMARKRLNYLVSIDWLKTYRDKATNQKVYFTDKKYNYHRILALDYYAKLVELGVEMAFFKTEFEWLGGKVRSDAFSGFIFNNKPYFNFVEVITSNNALNLEKYEKVYESGEAHKICGGKFPPVVLIDNVNHKKEFDLPHVKVLTIHYDIKDIAKVFQD